MIKIIFYFISLILIIESRVVDKLNNRQCFGVGCKEDIIAENVLCRSCEFVIPYVRELFLKNRTEELAKFTIFLCETFKIEDRIVCPQVLNSYIPSVFSVVTESSLSDSEVCSVFLNCKPIDNPVFNWTISLPDVPKPPVIEPSSPKPGSPVLKILQITDIHIDFEYQPGALAECTQPLCCRNTSTSNLTSITRDKTAGYWGDYRNCDVPVWTVENMFDHISRQEKFDIIYWTGDLPPHNVWNQSKSDQLSALDSLTTLFRKYFPDTLIYPALGNHEATPCNLFPTESTKDDNITWLYSRLSEDWVKTGLPESLKQNITRGAFYTFVIAPGLRLVSLNMNFCYPLNFWLYINSTDPYDQLKWLVYTLQDSENIGEKVHIIGHVNPSTCLKSFSESYYKIINRYESTVTGQFFGHKHNDAFEIFYDLKNNSRAVSVAYLAGSVTTFSFLNPSYRIYTVDGVYKNSSYQVLDHETTILNITDANLTNKPKWVKEYSAKEAYNMTGVYAKDWNKLVNDAFNDLNDFKFKKLYKNFFNSYDKLKVCDKKCKKKFLCDLKQARPGNLIPCWV